MQIVGPSFWFQTAFPSQIAWSFRFFNITALEVLMFTLITLTQPKSQNNSKNVWICPALCNHKGMSWDISAFPLQDPSFPTARPGLENLFPLSPSLCLWRDMNTTKGWFTMQAQCLHERKKSRSLLRILQEGISRLRSRVTSKSNRGLWKQTQKHCRVEWTFQAYIVGCCPGGTSCFLVLSSPANDCF